MDNEAINRKRTVLSVIAVLVLVLMVVGVTYAIFTYTGIGTKTNTIETGSITFTYQEDSNGITITNAQPMADAAGKVITETGANITQGYFDFSVSANVSGTATIDYEVYATDTSPTSNKLDPQYVKVYLTDAASTETPITGYEGTVPTYDSLQVATSDANGKKLYTGTFTSAGTKQFRLRLWVSDQYSVSSVSNTFSMKVNVKATS